MKSKKKDFFISTLLLGFFFGIFVLILHFKLIQNPIVEEIEIPKSMVDLYEEARITREKELNAIPLEQSIYDQMSIEERVSQLFMFGIDGNTSLEPNNKKFLQEVKPGSVLLFAKNITNENQLKKLTNEIQTTNPKIPLFIAIDQEGGVVSRIEWDRVLTEPQNAIGDNQEAYEIAKSRGEKLKELGVNTNLAPVVEYTQDRRSFIYNRTYRGALDEVIQKSVFTVSGYKNASILSVIKHYPGHGDTPKDPHFVLPEIKVSKNQWDRYIQPFSKTIKQIDVDAVMIGHILFPDIDNIPASLSKEIIQKRLIEDLDYKGLVVSDDMEMMALKSMGRKEEIAVKALDAGIDILIYSFYSEKEQGSQRSIYNHVLKKVQDGDIEIEEKVLKVLRMKIKYGLLNEDFLML